MSTFLLRPYQAHDRSDVHRLAADSAFFGDSVERLLEDRGIFCDILYAYYTDFEPEQAWVATVDERVVGYVMGCLNTWMQRRVLICRIVPAVLWRGARGGYRVGPLTRRWIRRLVSSLYRQDMASADLHLYPAHLHIGVDARKRGFGLGKQLMERFLDHMRRQKVSGVHLRTTDRNVAACRLYERLGMNLLDARPTRFWYHILGEEIESRCYGLRL